MKLKRFKYYFSKPENFNGLVKKVGKKKILKIFNEPLKFRRDVPARKRG